MIEDATEYVALDSPAAAQRFAADIVNAAESLSEFSERGRIVPELRAGSGHRELLIGAYRLVYIVEEEVVLIVAFVHGSRDFRSWWRSHRQERPN
jgi:plasmid stabilization system protein ParE